MNLATIFNCAARVKEVKQRLIALEKLPLPSGSRRALMVYAPLTFVLVGVNLSAFSVVAEHAIPALRLSYTESGLVVAGFLLSYALMQIPAGRLSDRWGGERVIRIFAVAAGVLALFFSVATDFLGSFLARVLLGIAVGSIVPATARVLSSNFTGRDLDRANGLFVAGWGASQILMFLVVPSLILRSEWRFGLHFVTVTTFAVAVAAWLLLPRHKLLSASVAIPDITLHAGRIFTRDMVSLMLIHVTGLGVVVGVLAWAPIYFADRLQTAGVATGLIVAVIGVTNLLSSLAGGELARRFGRKPVVVISMLLCLGTVPLFLVTRDILSAVLVAAGVGWGTIFYSAPVFAQVPEASPRGVQDAGMLFGVLNTAGNFGAFSTPFLLGILLDVTGTFEAGFLALTAFSMMGVVGIILFRERPSS